MVGLGEWTGRAIVLLASAISLALARPALSQTAPATASATTSAVTAPAAPLDPINLLGAANSTQSQRDEAALRLVLRQTPRALQALRAALIDAGNKPAQLAAARALAQHPVAQEDLKVPLRALIGSEPRLTDAAIRALAGFRDDPDVLNLLIRLATDPERQQREVTATRVSAIRALGSRADKRSAQALVELAGSAAEPAGIRTEATTALANMAAGAVATRDPAAWEGWWKANQNKDDATFSRDLLEAQAAQRAQLQHGFDRLADEAEARLVEAYQAAAETRRETMLLSYLRSVAPEVRAIGVGLVQTDFKQARPVPPSVRDVLRTMIGDSSIQVRVRVANALGLLNDEQAIDALLAQLESEPDAEVRRELAQALIPARDVRVVRPLVRLLSDPSPAVAEVAARGLGDTENLTPIILQDRALAEEVGNALRETLRTRTSATRATSLRAALVDAMGTLKDTAFRQRYTELVGTNETPAVRRAALRALGELGEPSAADTVLETLLRDKDPAIRTEAINALGKTANDTHAEAIFNFMNGEPDEKIRSAAWRVLGNIFAAAGQQPGPQQARWLNLWADRFRDQPERRLEVLEVLAKRLLADDRPAELASVRQNIGTELMTLSQRAAEAGDTEQAEEHAAKAATVYQLALNHYLEKDPKNQAIVTGFLREQRLASLLASRNYQDSARFAAESIAANPVNQEPMGVQLKREVDRLLMGKRLDDALKLIEAINGMDPKLADQYLDPIQRFEKEIRAKQGADGPPAGAAGDAAAGDGRAPR